MTEAQAKTRESDAALTEKVPGTGGFTLIEVLVSMLILAGVSLVLYQSWSGSLNAVRKGRLYNTVTLLLQKKVVDFEVKNKGKKIDELTENEEGDFGEDYPDFKWQIKLQKFSVPPILPPKMGSNDSGTSQIADMIIKVMTDYFEKAVREVAVTVTYTVGAHTSKYSVSTIFVDYTVEVPSGI